MRGGRDKGKDGERERKEREGEGGRERAIQCISTTVSPRTRWFLVLEKSLEVREGPGMPGLVGGSVVLSGSVVVLENGGNVGTTASPLL